jgi:hypothetical protein
MKEVINFKSLPLQLLHTKAPFEVHKPKKYLHISVPDPWDFGTNTDPQIRPGSGPVFFK